MAGFSAGMGRKQAETFWLGFLLLVCLITLFLSKPLFSNQPLLASDLLFDLDPLWQPLTPPGYSAPANQVLSDQALQFYPWQKFMRAEIGQGRLPLWNPYANSGHPLLANAQSALFDPFQLLALLWPLEKSFVVVAFLRLLCAGTFTLLLALELGLSRFPAYLAMVVFTFAGPQIVWLLFPKASVLVWLPALLYFSARLVHTGRWRDAVWLGLATGAVLLGGHPETALYNMLIWLLFCGFWLWSLPPATGQAPEQTTEQAPAQSADQNADLATAQAMRLNRPRRVRRGLQLAVAALLGVGLGAVQWLPLIEALLNSEVLTTRSQPRLGWEAIFLQWRDWLAALTMLMPDFFGNPRRHSYWYPYSNYLEQTLYVGLLPLGLALLVIGRQRWRQLLRPTFSQRQISLLIVLWFFSLGMALRLPGFTLLAELPLLNVTNSGRLRGLYMLVSALLAGYGLELLLGALASEQSEETNGAWRLWTKIVLALGFGAALIAAAAYAFVTLYATELVAMGRAQAEAAQGNPFFFRPLSEYLTLAQVRVEQMAASFHLRNWRMYLPLWIALALLGVWPLMRRLHSPQRRARFCAILVVAGVTGELWLSGLDFNPTVAPQDLDLTPPLVATLLQQADHDLYRVMGLGLALAPNTGMIFGLEDIRGYDPVAPRRYTQLVSRLPGAARVGHHLLFSHADTPFLDFLNVRYLFATAEVGEAWLPLASSQGVTLYANPEVMPRAFMVYTSRVAATDADSLEMTLDPTFDFRNEVILEGGGEATGAQAPALPPVNSAVVATRKTPGELVVQVETAEAGFLVLSEPYTPGWEATVDEQKVEILIANHAFRALRLPAGSHTVRFQYRPMSLIWGAWSSLVCLILLVLLPLVARRPHW